MDCVVKVQKSKLKFQINIARKSNSFTLFGRMVTFSMIAVLRAVAAPCFIPRIKRNAALSERRDVDPTACFRFLRLYFLLVPWG